MNRLKKLLPTLLLLIALPASAQVHEFFLDNGMQVLVKEDRRAPVAVSMVWYRVGSGHEHDGITGISHALEHMMFKGTESYAPGEFSRLVAERGGRSNAFTGRDFTAYFQQIERSHLDKMLQLEADRMQGLLFDPDEFAREMEVIKEERRLTLDDNPRAVAGERFNAVAFASSPYRHAIIGWMSDIESYTLDDLRAWYARWYAPNNAILVVVGDVDAEAVHAKAQRHFGPIPARAIVPPKPRPEVEPLGERRATVRIPAQVPLVSLRYLTPSLATADDPDDAYALAVAAAVLGGSTTARLQSRLEREREIVSSVSTGYNLYARLDDLFTVNAVPADGHDVAAVEAALRAEVARLRDERVDESELERIRIRVLADNVFQQDSLFYQGMLLGMLETAGIGWRELDAYAERIRAVTPEQVQSVARRYLVDDRLTVGILEPIAGAAPPGHGLGDSRPLMHAR